MYCVPEIQHEIETVQYQLKHLKKRLAALRQKQYEKLKETSDPDDIVYQFKIWAYHSDMPCVDYYVKPNFVALGKDLFEYNGFLQYEYGDTITVTHISDQFDIALNRLSRSSSSNQHYTKEHILIWMQQLMDHNFNSCTIQWDPQWSYGKY